MIESVVIANTATYPITEQSLDGLRHVNYFYGANGSGKTTISRLIADSGKFPTCKVNWKAGNPIQTVVYNRDFVERNFGPSSDIKGIFTLGEKHIETEKKILEVKTKIDSLTKNIESLNNNIEGDNGKAAALQLAEEDIKTRCWAQKQKYEDHFAEAMTGLRNSQDRFKLKVFSERATNSSALQSLDYLTKKAQTVFGETPLRIPPLSAFRPEPAIELESDLLLKKRVVGKTDVDIAKMIERLSNIDWVKEGRHYHDQSSDICPFCQQKTTEAFRKSLDEYFDETYINDVKAITYFANKYKVESERLLLQAREIAQVNCKFIHAETYDVEVKLLESLLKSNQEHIDNKVREPSQLCELQPIKDVCDSISKILNDAQVEIDQHNRIVANLRTERETLTSEFWKYILERELKADLDSYDKRTGDLKKAIEGIQFRIKESTDERTTKTSELSELEKSITSIQPTIEAINALLNNFGFKNFSLAKTADGKSYQLIRPDSSNARDSLSEGEKSFVTFLYFYYLVRGSESETGITTNRIVVFDDPVSSLDSDILFVVSSLIKELVKKALSNSDIVKQVFVLTHNVYFHKEVSYDHERKPGTIRAHETFWIIRKTNSGSKVEKLSHNPIRTSYELLWSELRGEPKSVVTIQNNLRRILEGYFKILGNINFDALSAQFEGNDKIICRSLFSWVNDGSHSTHDDLHYTLDETSVENYLRVFKEIFVKNHHAAHYEMMMGTDTKGQTPAA